MTTIAFDLHRDGHVQLQIFAVTGRRVATLVDGPMAAGWRHTVTWNGLDDAGQRVSSGVYFYRLVTGKFTQTKKMVMLK